MHDWKPNKGFLLNFSKVSESRIARKIKNSPPQISSVIEEGHVDDPMALLKLWLPTSYNFLPTDTLEKNKLECFFTAIFRLA